MCVYVYEHVFCVRGCMLFGVYLHRCHVGVHAGDSLCPVKTQATPAIEAFTSPLPLSTQLARAHTHTHTQTRASPQNMHALAHAQTRRVLSVLALKAAGAMLV